MKKNILLGCLLVLSFSCFSQKGQRSIGIIAGGHVASPTLFNGFNSDFNDDEVDNFERTFFAPAAGIYYNSDISNRLGVSIAVYYQNWKTNFNCPECRSVDGMTRFYKSQFSTIDLPVNLLINLRDKKEASWRPYFSVGYTYSQLVKYKFTNLESNEVINWGMSDSWGFNYHYLNTGFEIRHNFKSKLMLAICPELRIPLNDETRHFSKYYFGGQVKFGRNL